MMANHAAPELSSLEQATEWLNSEPLTAESLRGKVVLVDFWTYTCINWLRTFPYVRAWAAKYKDQGLVVVGAHSPEFSFERELDNVHRAVSELQVDYPVAVDSDHVIWRAFSNNYWPALYFVDAQGQVRHHQFGEGEYERAERVVQQMLVEAGTTDVSRDLVAVEPRGLEVAADWDQLRSPEAYVGYQRGEGFASAGGASWDERAFYAIPAELELNTWALSGEWTVQPNAIAMHSPEGQIAFRFHARDVNLVMGPGARGESVRFRVLVDGQAPGVAHGSDVDESGSGTVTWQRCYQLIRQRGHIDDHTVEITFLDPGAHAYVFTFG